MVFTNACYVHVARHHVQVIGGILMSIWVQLCWCKPIDGLSIPEINTLGNDYNSLPKV